MRNARRILCLFLALLLLAGCLSGCAPSANHPLTYLQKSLRKTCGEGLVSEILSKLGDALTGGSLQLSFGGTDAFEAPVDEAEIALYFGKKSEKVAATGKFSIGDQTYDARAWLSSDEAVVASDAFLGSGTFGVDFDTLERDLQGSIFRNNSGTPYARPEIGDKTAKTVCDLNDSFFSFLGALDDRADVLRDLTGDFLEILDGYASSTCYTQNGLAYLSITVDNNVLSHTLRDFYKKVVKDRAFCRELRALAAERDTLVSAQNGAESTAWRDEVEIWLTGEDRIEALCAKVDNGDPFSLSIEATTRRMSARLHTLDVRFTEEGEERFHVSVDLSVKRTAVLTFERGLVSHSLTLRRVKNGIRRYTAEAVYACTVGGIPMPALKATLALDRFQHTFDCAVSREDRGADLFNIAGSYTKKSGCFSLSTETMTFGGVSHRFELTLSIYTKADMPEQPEYTNLVTLSEQRFEPVASRAQAARETLQAAWEEADFHSRTFFDSLFSSLELAGTLPWIGE